MVFMTIHVVLISRIIVAVVVGTTIIIDGFWGVGAVGNRDTRIAIIGLGIRIANFGVGIGCGVTINVNLKILVGHG